MKRSLLCLSLVGLAVFSSSVRAQAFPATLRSMRDRQRVLLVFANGNNQFAETQLNVAAEHVDGFHERDLILVGLQGSKPGVPTAMLSSADEAAARKQFHVPPADFTVILLGKDGGEKLRSRQPITWDKLQSTIDAMPMRRDEIKGSAR